MKKPEQDRQLAAELNAKFSQLEAARRPFESIWDILAALCLPNRNGKFRQRGSAQKNKNPIYIDDIYDGTGAQSADYLTATLMGGLASKTLKWFKLKAPQFSMHETLSPQDFELNQRSAFMLDYIARPNTGFYTALSEATLETIALGTGIMECYYEPAEGIKYRAISLESCYICTDNHGNVDTLYRQFCMTHKQIMQQWGMDEDLDKEFCKTCEEHPYELIDIIRAVYPNEAYGAGKTDNYKFRSVYFVKDTGVILEDSVLDYFPYVVPRWSKVTDVDYGRSPAWTCKADMEMIQAMEMTALEAAQRAAIPALLTADDGVLAPIDHQAGGIIPGGLDPITGRPRIVPLNSGVNVPFLEQFIEQKREAVRKAFFNNQLINQNRPQMTAEEVSTLREENLRALSPSVLRFIDEVLYPLVVKTYHLLEKHRLFPAPLSPDGAATFKNYEVEVEFDSPLANTSKMADYQAFSRYFQSFLLPMAQTDPTIVDTLNMERAAYMNAYNLGVPLAVLNTPQESAAIKQGRAQAQQSQFQLQAQDIQSKAMLEQQKIKAMQGLKSQEDGLI
jgi:hypothetical protein